MKCTVHIDRDAIGTCSSCGKFVCPECKVSSGSQIYCNICTEARLKTGSWPGMSTVSGVNTSGMGSLASVPPEIKGWNWGGFFLTWIWGIGNNTWISFLALLGMIPWVGWIASLTMRIILGIYGNEWAWRNKKWDSVEHFKSAQRKWMWWGLTFYLMIILLVIAVIVLAISLVMIARTSGMNMKLPNLDDLHLY